MKILWYSFFLLLFFQCTNETKVDEQKILQAAVNAYGRSHNLYFTDSLISTRLENSFLSRFEEVTYAPLNLKCRVYRWCIGYNCYDRIIYLNNGVFDYAFPFEDADLFYGYYPTNPRDTTEYLKNQKSAQTDILLDDQLSFIAGKLQLQSDSVLFNSLITLVADSLLQMNEIYLAEAKSMNNEFDKENIPDFISTKERCAATFKNTLSEVINGLKNGSRYFFGNGFGGDNVGIWEFQLLPIPSVWTKKQGQYYLQIRVLNHECIVQHLII